MRIFVAIANYGTANDKHLARLICEYRSMPYDVHIVVLSNLPKDLGPDIEVRVGLPAKNPWSLPFAHKRVLDERVEQYDIFIYTEDDTLIERRNIEAFLGVTRILPPDEIAGLLRSETGSDGRTYFSTIHSHFHWEPDSVVSRGPYTFARFTNDHSGCFLLTRYQLRRALASGGFLVGPHEGKYGLLETAATDPYTQCGFKKVICVSHLSDFTVAHLPNKYIGRMGLESSDVQRQIEALLAIHKDGRPATRLVGLETRVHHLKWSKSYYEPCQEEILSIIPSSVRTLLSVGCGWGATEGELVRKGICVVGIPLDSVIAACAEARGVAILYADLQAARKQLAKETFDCIMLSNLLHLMENPVAILSSLKDLLHPDGSMVVTIPNLAKRRVFWQSIRGEPAYRDLGEYAKSGVQLTSRCVLHEWLRSSGLKLERAIPLVAERWKWVHRLSLGLADDLLASDLVVVGKRA